MNHWLSIQLKEMKFQLYLMLYNCKPPEFWWLTEDMLRKLASRSAWFLIILESETEFLRSFAVMSNSCWRFMLPFVSMIRTWGILATLSQNKFSLLLKLILFQDECLQTIFSSSGCIVTSLLNLISLRCYSNLAVDVTEPPYF